jgi:eukaryotic-like serine/threonine-protein kinase
MTVLLQRILYDSDSDASHGAITAVATVFDLDLATVDAVVLRHGLPHLLTLPAPGVYGLSVRTCLGEESTSTFTTTVIDGVASHVISAPADSDGRNVFGAADNRRRIRPESSAHLWLRSGSSWHRTPLEYRPAGFQITSESSSSASEGFDGAAVETRQSRGTPLITRVPTNVRLAITWDEHASEPDVMMLPDRSGAVALLYFLHRSDLASARLVVDDMLHRRDHSEPGFLDGLALAYFFCRTRANEELRNAAAHLSDRFPESADTGILQIRAWLRTPDAPEDQVRSRLLAAYASGPPLIFDGLQLLADTLRRSAQNLPARDPVEQASSAIQRYLGAALDSPLTTYRGTDPGTPTLENPATILIPPQSQHRDQGERTAVRMLPLVSEVDDAVQLGVHPAVVIEQDSGLQRVPPFVLRDKMPFLQERLHVGERFILLVGTSTAGKSRLAYELMHAQFPDYELAVPDSPEGIGALVPVVCNAERVVLWLDDLDRYLGAGGLTSAMVEQMLDRRRDGVVVILATMTAQQLARFTARSAADDEPGKDFLHAAGEVIKMSKVVTVSRRWSIEELQRAQRFAHDPRIEAAIAAQSRAVRRGVAEYLAAAPELLAEWREASNPGAHPRAAALVAGAVDARRAGYHRSLSEELLHALHEHYLESGGGSELRPEPWAEALQWATTPLHAASSLLLAQPDGGYLAFDYLHNTLDAQAPPPRIPEATWKILVEHTDSATALDIGTAAFQRGDLGHALIALDKAITSRDRKSRQAYALCVFEAGDPQRAAGLYAELVDESRAELGEDAEETLANLHGYARCVGDAGRPAAAVKLLEEVIAHRRRVLGPEHPHTLNSLNSRAFFVGEAGDARRAVDLYESVVADRARLLGPEHPHTLDSRYGHAYFLGDGGRPAAAARLFEALVADRTRLQGPYYHYTLNNRRHHAHYLGEAGHSVVAADLFEILIEDCLKVVDPDHPDTLASRHGHARFLGESGHPRRAAELLAQLVHDDEKFMQAPSPVTLLHRRYHAYFVGEGGKPKQAVRMLNDIITQSGHILDDDHPLLLACRLNHARFIGKTGQVAEAAVLYQQLIDRCGEALGADHPLTLASRNGHARHVGKSGEPARAAALLETLLEDRTRVLGDDHPHTLNSRTAHAYFLGQAGNGTRAIGLLEVVLADRLRLFDAEHPQTLRTQRDLVELRHRFPER